MIPYSFNQRVLPSMVHGNDSLPLRVGDSVHIEGQDIVDGGLYLVAMDFRRGCTLLLRRVYREEDGRLRLSTCPAKGKRPYVVRKSPEEVIVGGRVTYSIRDLE